MTDEWTLDPYVRAMLPIARKYIPAEWRIDKIVPPEDPEDYHNAADIILQDEVRIACRVRFPGINWRDDWYDQFTVRSKRNSGTPTKLNKLMMWSPGDSRRFMVYGFVADVELIGWHVLDLAVWRRRVDEVTRRWAIGDIPNTDGKTSLRAYHLAWFPKAMTVGRLPVAQQSVLQCGVCRQKFEDSAAWTDHLRQRAEAASPALPNAKTLCR